MLESNSKGIPESEGLLQDLFYHARDLIQVVAHDGTLLYVNKAWSDILGYELEEIQGKSVYAFIAPQDRDRYSFYRSSILNGEVAEEPLIFMLASRDGKSIIVEGKVSVRRSSGGSLFTMGIFRDISQPMEDVKRLNWLNEQLREREFNFQQLLTHAPDAIIVIDQDSLIKYWNPKAEQMFGWKAGDVLNSSLTKTIIPLQYREAHENGMKRFLSTGVEHVLNRTVEITALNKAGMEFFVALTISRAAQNSGAAFIAFIRDITDNKKSQLEIHEKTRQLEQSNKNLEAFAYAASHDLKQPIRKIQIFSERLSQNIYEQLDSVNQDFLDKISKAATRMRELVENLLTFSSISTDQDFFSEVNLNDVVSDTIDDLELEISSRSISITTDHLPIIQGNARQLHQLFLNLIGNSIKYSKANDENRIELTCEQVNGDQAPFDLSDLETKCDFFLIKVRDIGIGFRPDQAEKIFEVFTRLHNQDKYQGSGVGLSIARKVVENHRGFIKAEGDPGNGACFTILLPCDRREKTP